MDIGRPATKAQPSRKGKKSWRKNVDIDDIEQGLENAREMERVTGAKVQDDDNNDTLFTVDVAGDEKLDQKKMKDYKPLKATEILSRRSAVPALNAVHKKKEQPKKKVNASEMERLMQVAGRTVGKSATKAMVDKEGIKDNTYDLWGDSEPQQKKQKKEAKKKDLNDYSFLHDMKLLSSHQLPAHAPETMQRAPINFMGSELRAIVEPEAGKSYNPDEQEWLELLKKEGEREQAREEERLKLVREKERIEEVMRTMPDNEVDDDLENDDEEDDDESDQEPVDVSGSLSLNVPAKNKKKSRQQRSKQKRHQEKMEMQNRVKDLKQQIRDLHNLPKLLKQEMERIQKQREEREQDGQLDKKRKKKLGKHHIKEAPLEIKLSDELSSCLRRLKPEGDLTTERFRSLQQRGLIEARVPVAKRRRYKKKVTEKWSYKDFK